MKIKLGKHHINYLVNNSHQEQELLHQVLIQTDKEAQFIFIEVDYELADEIRDWAGEQLQKKGFDINYELNQEGKILEELIDLFYIKDD